MTRLFLTAGLLTVTLMAAPAVATDAAPASRWLWSNSSALLNRATTELAQGRTERGARMASEVLAAGSPLDRRIAAHNLCLVHAAGGADVKRDPLCREASRGPDAPVVLQDGALIVGRKDGASAGTLDNIIAENMVKAAERAMLASTAP